MGGNGKDWRRGHEGQDPVLRVGAGWDLQHSLDTGEGFVLQSKAGHFLERLRFDLWGRDSGIGPVVSHYRRLLAARRPCSLQRGRTFLRKLCGFGGLVLQKEMTKQLNVRQKLFLRFFFLTGTRKDPFVI